MRNVNIDAMECIDDIETYRIEIAVGVSTNKGVSS